MRLGILGGTFDPVHTGHIALAAGASRARSIEKVLFVPNANPPHKQGRTITAYAHRTAMLKLALKDIDLGELSEVETTEDTPNYTVDTIEKLRASYDGEFIFIIGSDEVRDLAGWKEPKKILDQAEILVVSRAGCAVDVIDGLAGPLGADAACRLKEGALTIDVPDISSTVIRGMISRDEDITGLVNPEVAEYIAEHGLYRN
jgi:nicotinate-nucleotide adenylyltransferase